MPATRRLLPMLKLTCALNAALCSGEVLADPPVEQLGEVTVVGVAPLPGFNVPVRDIPLHVQSAQADDIKTIHGQSITDLLEKNFQGVNVTQSQGNPWQGNLYFHGFTLSPLLGSPSGMSIYVDGVRQNEPFAETMNWEAIPDFAIRDVTLIPSSSPLYGLNTLGGALLLTTKSGFTDPGGSIDLSGGSWGRIQESADFGWHGKTFGLYAGIGADDENGWRDHSPSRVRQAFVRGDWKPDDATDIALSYTAAHSKLYGTQTIPVEWVSTPRAAFTWPDYFTNNLGLFNLQGSRELGGGWSLQAHAYLRISQSRSFDSNTNDYGSYDDDDGPPGYASNGPFNPASLGQYVYAGLTPAYDPQDPGATINNTPGSNVLGNVHTRGYGTSIQAVDNGTLGNHDNQLTVGTSLDAGESRFTQYGQPAYFPDDTAQRGDTIGLQPFGLDPMTAARSTTRTVGLYFMDVLALGDSLHVSAGGRYDHSQLANSDLSGSAPDIDGRQTFHRFNPSLGFTWNPNKAFGAYINYDEGMRTPTPIELECADPAAPCALPNDFTGDPPLKPVVAHTLSAGLRGNFDDGRLHWNISPYYSRVSNDILTIYTGGSSQGYFANVPKTLRKGVDLGIGGLYGKLEWQANLSYTDATYGAPFEEQSENNTSADDAGVIAVNKGDHLPGIPRTMFTFSGEYHLTRRWSAGANVRAYAGQYAVGDENNADGHGKVPGYAITSLDAHFQASQALSFFAEIDNLFDRRYFISGQLSDNVFDTPGRLIDTTGPGTPTLFVAPGAPRAFFVGASYAFGGAND